MTGLLPDTAVLVAFATTAAVVVAIPGPSTLFIVGRALQLGRRGGILTAAGDTVGLLPAILLVSLGVGYIVARQPEVLTGIRVLGAAYLVFLGVRGVLAARSPHPIASPDKTATNLQALRQGALVSVTNPKSLLFLLAVLPQFVAPETSQPAVQLFILGLLFAAISGAGAMGTALIASALSRRAKGSPGTGGRVAGGFITIAVGVVVGFGTA